MTIKKAIVFLMCVLTVLMVFVSSYAEEREMRGVWVSTVYGIDYPQEASDDFEVLAYQVDEIIDNMKAAGFNTIFLQVRPSCDAIYPSELFTMSRHLTGGYGRTVNGDILEYWIEKAHENNIELHAWVNPYRVTTGGASEYESLPEDHIAKQHPEWLLEAGGNYYLDPSLHDVRQLVCAGVEELIQNYDIDGIHMDDYFYPSVDFDDSADYEAYREYAGENAMSADDWRRNNVDTLINDLHSLTTQYGMTFGISPCAIWENKSNNPLGSDTNGFASYSDIYADTRKWALNGWVDYIAPQIYFENGHSLADFRTLLDWWSDTLVESDTKLYIGLADYKADDTGPDSIWYDGKEVSRQILQIRNDKKAEGAIHFSYSSVFGSPMILAAVTERYVGYDAGLNTYDGDRTEQKTAVCTYYDINNNLIKVQTYNMAEISNEAVRFSAPEEASYAKCSIYDQGAFESRIIKIVM